jgi:formiminotetrahydrofolate cyclodeaminase
MADYYSVIAHAVSRLPRKTDEAKQAIYERARAALRKALRSPFSETELVAEQAALEVAISMVEVVNDIRNGADLNHHPELRRLQRRTK